MIREAELFVQSERVLAEVLRRVRPDEESIVLPPLRVDGPREPISAARQRLAAADAEIPAQLGVPGDPPVDAASRVDDAAKPVAEGDLTVGEYLLRHAVDRAFVAHDVAMHLGSRACPLLEDQARGLWERTQPDVDAWRERGVFGAPLEPVPADVSWRDRFLMACGRDPHALD